MIPQNLMSVPAGTLIKTTLVDFPGRVAATVFLKGCNLRCPYCYNKELVLGSEEESLFSTPAQILSHLEKRKNVLSGFVISGGEPLLNPLTPYLIKEARKSGYKIKIDTNGTLPDKLQELLLDQELCPDFIAMDLKTNPDRYDSLFINHDEKQPPAAEQLSRSAKMISTLPPDHREWRTVLVPTLVDEKDLAAMAKILPPDATWQFAQFRNENCIDPLFNTIPPYLDSDLNRLVSYAKSFIPGAHLR